eukprot:scaffold5403_cov23-Tisochrysis_lutea.AAC.3
MHARTSRCAHQELACPTATTAQAHTPCPSMRSGAHLMIALSTTAQKHGTNRSLGSKQKWPSCRWVLVEVLCVVDLSMSACCLVIHTCHVTPAGHTLLTQHYSTTCGHQTCEPEPTGHVPALRHPGHPYNPGLSSTNVYGTATPGSAAESCVASSGSAVE